MSLEFPDWHYFPSHDPAPVWAEQFLGVVRTAQTSIDSRVVDGLTSDGVLKHLAPGLTGLGYEVETGKTKAAKIRRPVLYGDRGSERVAYEVDAVHDELGVVVEVEAGRGARGNAVYRDLIRSSLIVGAQYLVLGVMQAYRHNSGGKVVTVESYRESLEQMHAIYASGRLVLPFEGILLFGY